MQNAETNGYADCGTSLRIVIFLL